MSRISDVFGPGHKTLIAYVTVGYPTIDTTLEVVPLLAKLGCDIVELGIPFSDPLADGATIQKASFNALHNGVTPEICLEIADKLRRKTEVPLAFMSYYNPIFNYGLDKFVNSCTAVKVDALIVPDLPPDEGTELERITRNQDIDLIYLLAPTSTGDRIQLVSEHSQGFIYLVSIAGVTGARNHLPQDLERFVQRVRASTDKPLCVGFGISTPEQAREVAQYADGVIVGSRLVQLMEEKTWQAEVSKFITSLRSFLDNQ